MRDDFERRRWSDADRDPRRATGPIGPNRPDDEWDDPARRGQGSGYGSRPSGPVAYGPGAYDQPAYDDDAYGQLGTRDWRGQWARGGNESLGQDSDVPGYEWQDSGAAMTTGRDFDPGGWRGPEPRAPEQRRPETRGRERRDMGGRSNQTSEPGPNQGWDMRQAPEETSGLDRPPSYRLDDPRAPGYDPRSMRPQRYGDGRYGRPDEWSSRQSEWPNRPSRYEDANSGYGPVPAGRSGAGMGAGMYWSGESAREDDEMRGHMPTGRQIPGRGSLAEGGAAAPVGRRGPHAGRGPRGYRRSDERIAEDVSERLTDDEFVDASDLSITIQEGVVVLEGSVDSRDARRRAEDVAASCSGVQDVMNRLTVAGRDGGDGAAPNE